MSKAGYNKLLVKLQECLADNLGLRSKVMELQESLVNCQKLEPPKSEADKTKFREFWTSSASWGAVGAMLGALASQISILVLAFLCWGVIVIDFWRIRFGSPSKAKQAIINVAFALVAGAGFFLAIKYTPHATTLDQKIDKLLNRPQNITNVYPETVITKTIGGLDVRTPLVTARFVGLHGDIEKSIHNGGLQVEETEINSGDAIAKGVWGIGDLFYGPPGADAENKIFQKLREVPVARQSVADLLPGPENARPLIIGHTGSPIDIDPTDNMADTSNRIFSGTYRIYVTALIIYRDKRGRPHVTEQCLVGTNLVDDMGYCVGHNQSD